MNNNIIKKCLDELKKEEFRKDYVIGMLETYYEMSEQQLPTYTTPNLIASNPLPLTATSTQDPEGVMLNKVAEARLNEVKKNTKYE